jgi:DNA-binding CsgD family transcriptional regulator
VLSRAEALLADESEAEPLFERAVRNSGEDRWPFERANAQLEYGAWLRRRHRALDARTQLRAAVATFDRIGAVSWSRAAARELRAAGVHLDRPDDATARWAQLTAQEREIVTLAAKGLTNREIGGTLFLSPRTVSAHLYHAFPKLGVTSRAQLRDIVDRFRDGR